MLSPAFEVALLGLQPQDALGDGFVLGAEAVTCPEIGDLVDGVANGRYLDVIGAFDNTELARKTLIAACQEQANPFYSIHDCAVAYLSREKDANRVAALAVAYLQLYVQSNYTGPELAPKHFNLVDLDGDRAHNTVLTHLECDGSFPYKAVILPQLLLIARILLTLLCDPKRASWRENVELDEEGRLLAPQKPTDAQDAAAAALLDLAAPRTLFWWAARAAVLHGRVLQAKTYETMPTLWLETKLYFGRALREVCALATETVDLDKDETYCFQAEPSSLASLSAPGGQRTLRILQGLLWTEWGLARHHFVFQDQGKKAFARAKDAVQLLTNLTAAMGKRMKYQREDAAQLLLYARSSIAMTALPSPPSAPAPAPAPDSAPVVPSEPAVSSAEAVEPEMLEMGRRMVKEARGGEEAALREVFLDTVDTGAAENVILEGGPRFADPTTVNNGGQLHPLDQAVVLALCLDVANSNPADGLTNAEMQPYIERVLGDARNWMVHSTALLERSWIEYERRKTMDRALLQIQALIDQHTTKLTLTQSTYECIEDSAPAHERICYVYGLVYPSQFELKRDLAERYLRCQVFMSALTYFRELEMWDEVVTCYQLMQKPQRAEIVVREQLRVSESPYMVTALADLTGQEDLYERAWVLSQCRYARAKRTLGKICYDRGDFNACIGHLSQALRVQPLVPTAWYLKGTACMRVERWDEGVQAFVRCVQQDDEIGEAWANIGAIYMHTKQWTKAHQALSEAYKVKRDDWKVLENLLMVTLNLQLWKEAIRVMSSLVDLRLKSNKPLHVPQLRFLAKVVLLDCGRMAENEDHSEERSEAKDKLEPLPELARLLQAFFAKIAGAVKSDPLVWDVIAEYYSGLGHYAAALEMRLKQFRALISEPQWERKEEDVRGVEQCAGQVLEGLEFAEAAKADFYSCKMLLQSTVRKVEAAKSHFTGETTGLEELLGLLRGRVLQVEGMLASRGL